MTQPSDVALIHRFLDGRESAFRTLYECHTPRLKMTVRRLLGFRQQGTDDVIQETWLAACRGMHSYRGDAPFGAWLAAIAARATYATLTRLTSREMEPVDDNIAAPDQPEAPIDIEGAPRRSSNRRGGGSAHPVEARPPGQVESHRASWDRERVILIEP